MSRPGRNQYISVKKEIKADDTADFVFTIDEEGFIWRYTDFKMGVEPYHDLATVPYEVTEVKRKFAGEDQETSMGQGNIPLDLFCRHGDQPHTLEYEEPIKGGSKILIKVVNTDATKRDVYVVVWGAPMKQDPYYVRPEDWPKMTPFQVAELDRTE